jgi:predicted enzyme related to lactoylglutathione lyase
MSTQNPTNPVAYTELHTNDPGRARTFYGELFGWKSEEEANPAGPYWMIQGVLAGITAPRDGVPPGWIPYIEVDSVTAATSRARALGGGAPRLHRHPPWNVQRRSRSHRLRHRVVAGGDLKRGPRQANHVVRSTDDPTLTPGGPPVPGDHPRRPAPGVGRC